MINRDTIIRMFHEAGESAGWKPGIGNQLVINYLTRFAALVAAAEREACASICEEYDRRFDIPEVRWCAQDIRARSAA